MMRESFHADERSTSLRGASGTRSGAFRRSAIQRALGMGHEDRPVAEGAQTEDGQEDLVLSAAPGTGGVDVECEHSSHSFANLSPT